MCLLLHVLTTLLCMARVPRVEVFLVFLKETADAATDSPAALERNVREKANENSLTVWRGMSPEWRGAGAASEGARNCGPSYARRRCGSWAHGLEIHRKMGRLRIGARVRFWRARYGQQCVKVRGRPQWRYFESCNFSDCEFGNTIFSRRRTGQEIRRVQARACVWVVAIPLQGDY